MNTFDSFDLLASLQKTLAEKNFVEPTEIQSRAIPLLLEGRSIVGVSETGSGKTMAYALPVLHQLKCLEHAKIPVTKEAAPRAVIVVPARELGEQVTRVFKPFTHDTRLRVRSVLGGSELAQAKRSVAGAFEILVATPGRLIKLMECEMIDLSDVRVLVFDEADQMLDRGFYPAAQRIVNACPRHRQMALFSATVSPKVQELIAHMFKDAEVIKSGGSHRTVSGLTTKNVEVADGKRLPQLAPLLDARVEGGTMIFVNTREQCDRLASEMKTLGYDATVYRGEMDKVERRKNLKLFREGKIRFLISTDLASRGLDVDHVGRVINFHLPQQMENYIHRVGRTARAGRKGVVVNFVTERDQEFIAKVDRLRSREASIRGPKTDTSAEWPSEPMHKARVSPIQPAGPGLTGKRLTGKVTVKKKRA